MIADLDNSLTALYVELADRIIPSRGFARRGPGRPLLITDAELVCLAGAQVLLRHDDERHWLRAAPKLVGHLFPRLLGERVQRAAEGMRAADGGHAAPGSRRCPLGIAELLRLMDDIRAPCGQSVITAKRSDLAGYAGYRPLRLASPVLLGDRS